MNYPARLSVLEFPKSFNVLFINLFPVFWRMAFFCPAGTGIGMRQQVME
jgi:hypothetical protein